MDQQAADRAKAAAAAVGDEITTSSASGTTTMMVTEVKQEPGPPISPQQVTDEASLMYTLDKNKESLKRKLMMRRSLNELVDQGIYPPPKTPPAFMEQRKSLERAKIGDSLRFKIQHRPDRQQLVQQHILEDTNIDPSLHERQRLLKKSRLTDSLNDKLSHRPGVLELVQGNILQPDGKLHQLIRDGSISFDIPEDEFPDYDLEDGKSSDEALSPDQTDDSNLSDISSPPVPPAPELPTSFSKSLSFSPQINFSQESKVTLPFNSSPFTIPQQTTSSGSFTALSAGSLVSNSVVSPRSHITVSTINNSNKSRPKKPKPKPQPKSKVIKFHEYKGPPNVVKSTQPVPSSAVINVNMAPPTLSQAVNSDTPYHILLQQQQLFLQWQLEFNQKNLNVPVIVPAQKDILASAAAQTVTSGLGSIVGTSSAETAPVNVTSHTVAPTVLTVTTSGQHAQPPTQIQHIRISSPVMTHIKQEPQLGQPQPQLNPQITPMSSSKPVVKKPTVTVPSGPPKQYNSLEEMKVAELKAELKKRNLTVSGPKPQLIERLKPYADAIIRNFGDKSPSSSVTSPGSSVLSPSGSVISSRADVSPQSFSVMSPPSSMTSSHGTKTVVISPLGSAMSSNNSFTMTLPVSVVTSSSGTYSQPGSVQSTIGSLTSPGSVCSSSSSVNSPSSSVISQPGSVLSRPGSVMSPLGSVIDETLSTNAVSPLPSIQSMQSAVSVSNMAMMPDDLSNPFSPPSSPLFMENVMTPLSPDLMEIHVQSPPDLNASVNKSHSSSSLTQLNINTPIPNHNQNINLTMEQSRPPSVASVVPSEADKMDTDMDIDLELSHSFNSGVVPSISGVSANQQITPPPPPLPTLTKINLPVPMKGPQSQQQQHNLQQQQILQQIQTQLSQLQQKQKQHQQQQLSQPSTSAQLSQEEMLKQQQEKIEKLQSQLEESKLQLQLQQLQHQQMQQQQQQLQQLEQQAQQLQQQQQQQAVQQQQQQQQIVQTIQHQQQQQQQQQVTTSVTSPVVSQPMVAQPQVQHTQVQAPLQAQNHAPVIQSPTSHTQTGTTPTQSAPQVISIQNPTTTPQQVIFSVPTAHNGTKGHMLGNLKQIQLPAHVYHAVQNSQGQTVIVAQSPKTTSNKNKPPSLEFIKNQALNQTLNLGGGKSLIAVSSAPSGLQQFIITTAAVPPKQTTSVPHMNGLTQPPAQKMTASLPTSPVESTQRPVARTTSNPFFIPMKEPPKYDEAVKNKQTKLSGDNSNGQQSTLKSQTMDDVLEILIRTGELPASAAQEPPPTPKTVTQSPTVPTISISQSNMVSLTEGTNTTSPGFSQTSPSMPQYNQSIVFSPPSPLTNNNSTVNKSYNEEYKDNKNFIYTPMEAGMANMNYNNPEIKQEPIKTEPKSPLAFTAATLSDNSNSNDFFDLNDVINSDLNTMDWTSETAFGDLDLTDTTNINHAMDLIPNDNSLLSIPMANSPQRSIHGSEPDLATLGFADMDTNCNMQIDVPDWLDVIMPTTGLTPVSTSAPTSFPADPILTPRTQQEVLDLFAFDESDLNTPSDLNCGSNWDKLTGTTSS